MESIKDVALLQQIGIGMWFLFVVLYVYMAYCLQRMAGKTQTPNRWMAWIPILNVYLMCRIAAKPGWWVILTLIPIVQIIFLINIWLGMAKALGKPEWSGVLLIIPVVNLVIWSWWAFSK